MAKIDSKAPSDSGGLWAITSYYNPVGYHRRRANYKVFRKHMPIPLLTVELGFGAEFELGEDAAEILVRVRGGDVLWQKERLLSIALAHLPKHCDKVVWVDCDVVLTAPGWAERTDRALEQCPLLQPFDRVMHLGPDDPGTAFDESRAEIKRGSFAAAIAAGASAAACLDLANDRPYPPESLGLAWGARRQLLEQIGFYDACILGAGDRAMVAAYFGCFDHVIRRQCMHANEVDWYMDWATRARDLVRGQIGAVSGDLFHLWHGDIALRRQHVRHKEFSRFMFDPSSDIAIGNEGAWRWNSEKPEMHAFLSDYFFRRREDGAAVAAE